MQTEYVESKVISNNEIEKNIFELVVDGEFNAKPGQFYMLRAWDREPLLSRPISVFDKDTNTISFLYILRGRGTNILKELKKGDSIKLLGPLGNGFETGDLKGKIALITGGIGIAPLLLTAKAIKSSVDLYAGFRDDVYATDRFVSYVDNIYVATESGKIGHKGLILDMFNPLEYNNVLCCGPEIMMKRVIEKCEGYDIDIYISMERRMACGVGACLGCTVNIKGEYKRACKDGPVFSGRDVIFDA